jgi:hypothetical protein
MSTKSTPVPAASPTADQRLDAILARLELRAMLRDAAART